MESLVEEGEILPYLNVLTACVVMFIFRELQPLCQLLLLMRVVQ